VRPTTVCGQCGRQRRPLWLIGRAWLCLWCVDPWSLPELRDRVRFAKLRATATLEDIRERREQRSEE
jgi:hypothetical protein